MKHYTLLYIYVAAAVICMAACQRPARLIPVDVEERLMDTEDSVSALSPNALKLVAERQDSARDSLEYYHYEILKAKWWTQMGVTDSILRYEQPVEHYARTIAASREQRHLLALALNYKAAALHIVHQSQDRQIALYTEAYQTLLHPGDSSLFLPDICANMADAYEQQNQLPMAAQWYRRALFLVDSLQLGDRQNMSLYMGLGRIYTQLGDYATADSLYRITARYKGKTHIEEWSFYLNNYGNFYYTTRRYDEALKKFLELRDFLHEMGRDRGYEMLLCQINLADTYYNLGNNDKAREMATQAKQLFAMIGDESGVYYANTILMGVASHEGHYAEVEQLLRNESSEVTQTAAIGQTLKDIRTRYLIDYQERRGNYPEAFRLLMSEKQREDSLGLSRQNLRAAEIMSRFEQDTLRLHHDVLMEKAQTTNSRLWLALVLVVVAGLLAVWLWRERDKRRQAQTEAEVARLRLTTARNRISPHFTFNVLNSGNQENIVRLSKLIRSNLELATQERITLADELAFVREYLDVVAPSVGGIERTVTVSPDIHPEQVLVPSMCIQLLVENAVKHGFRGAPTPHQLSITITHHPSPLTSHPSPLTSSPPKGGSRRGASITVENNGHPFDIARQQAGNGLHILRTIVAMQNRERRGSSDFDIRPLPDDGGTIARLVFSQ